MPTTRRANTPTLTERLRRVYVPCPSNKGNKSLTIKIFDKHELISEMATPHDVITELQKFLNGMSGAPALAKDIADKLSSLSFTVRYEVRGPGKAEIENFAVTDFPIHLLTASGLFVSSPDEIIELMIWHRIPEITMVAERSEQSSDLIHPFTVFPYKDFENDWRDKTILGFGIPGRYFITQNNQLMCRKMGVIKMQGFMTENLPIARREEKILFVLKHELGHMFGLRHKAQTIMNDKYDIDQLSRYTDDQLFVVSQALDALIHS